MIPGTPGSLQDWARALAGTEVSIDGKHLTGPALGTAVSWLQNDGFFAEAFGFGTVTKSTQTKIGTAPGALILTWFEDLREARPRIVRTVRQLGHAGALAVRLEESKLGWELDEWASLLASENPSDWHRCAVTLLTAPGSVQSCGMHVFSMPDSRVEHEGPDSAAQEFVTALNTYQLAEEPDLLSGHTFSPSPDVSRKRVVRWPDLEYPADHVCHNPYGVWRLLEPEGSRIEVMNPVFVFTPALVAQLRHAESQAQEPLTRDQVMSIRDSAACIAMEPKDARTMERSRGYADLEPELVWEQWRAIAAIA